MTLPLSYWPGGSVATLTDIYIKAVIVFWLLANVITTERRLQLIPDAVGVGDVDLARQSDDLRDNQRLRRGVAGAVIHFEPPAGVWSQRFRRAPH